MATQSKVARRNVSPAVQRARAATAAFVKAGQVAAFVASEAPAHQQTRATAADLARDMRDLAAGREAATIPGLQQLGWTRKQIDDLGDEAREILTHKVAA